MKTLSQLITLSAFLFSAHTSAECLKDGQNVTLTGTIFRETFPGPPNYESIEDGDTPETYWILTIKTPQCVIAESAENDELYEVANSTIRFQLAFETSNTYQSQKNLEGSTAVVKGQLFIGTSGHHHTEALISVKSISTASLQASQ